MTKLEVLQELAKSNTCTESQERTLRNIVLKMFPSAVITCGIVYLEGKGTPEFPPMSCHIMAKALVEAYEKSKK